MAHTTTALTAALRTLADVLDSAGDDIAPDEATFFDGPPLFSWYPSAEQAADLMRRLPPTRWVKTVSNLQLRIEGEADGIRYRIALDREVACRRVVTGRRTVTEEIPDPEALAAVPLVAVTREVDVVEWDCLPALAGARSA
jgi:hypothetical protein